MNKSVSTILALAGVVCATIFSNCSNSQWMTESQNKAQGVALLKIDILPNSPFKQIAKKAVLVISAPDMMKMTKSLGISDSNVYGTINNIPSGKNRLFEVFVYDSLEVLQYRGSAYADVSADSTVMVSISITRVMGSAVINGTINDTGSGNTTPDLTTGLMAYYPFNGNTKDESGHGFNTTASGVTFVSDRFGNYNKACNFDGSATLSTTVSNMLSLSKVTLCVWMKNGGAGSYLPRLISVGIPNEAQCYYGLLFANGVWDHVPDVTQQLIFMTGTASDMMDYSLFYSNASIDKVTWHHAVASFDSGRLRFYRDGVLDKDTMVNTTIEKFSNSAVLTIGCSPGPDRFVGTLDEVRIYNRALTDKEIQALYSLEN